MEFLTQLKCHSLSVLGSPQQMILLCCVLKKNLWPGFLTKMCSYPSFCMSPFELQNKHIYIYGVEGEINLLALQLEIRYFPSPIRVMLGLGSSQQPRVLMHGVSGRGDSNGSFPTSQTGLQKPSGLRFPWSITHNKLKSSLIRLNPRPIQIYCMVSISQGIKHTQ